MFDVSLCLIADVTGNIPFTRNPSRMSPIACCTLRASRSSVARVGLFALLVASAACADPSADAGTGVAQYELVEVATIGGADDEGPNAFGQIAGVAFAPGGRIAVLDNVYHEVRLFADDGRFVSRAGREGSGPGELRSPYGLGVAPDGVIWVRDNGNGRYVRFALTGDSLQATTTLALSEGVQGPGIAPTFGDGGQLFHLGLASSSTGGAMTLTRFTMAVDAREPSARIAVVEPPPDSIGQFAVAMGGGATRYFYQPYAPLFLHTHAAGGDWARAVSSIATVERYDVAGTLIHRVTVRPEPVALSTAEQARADSIIARDRATAGRELPFSVPTTKQPLRAIYFDHAGRLWVEQSVPQGGRRLADVFDASGAPFGRVTWPAEIDLNAGALGADLMAGVARDELDVQRVVLLRMQAVTTRAGATP